MIIHIDCNAFFASCEIATRSGFDDKPVVVANINENGGGIILALNNDAKSVGLKRGDPIFKVKNLIEKNEVNVFPVNHKKYSEISKEIMQCVINQEIVLDFVQYSVDEFFGMIPLDDSTEVRKYVELVKNCIMEKTKIPVSCGCSQTYTLSKVATYFAKNYAGYGGICVLMPENREKALSLINIDDVWGIGRSFRAKLHLYEIRTALDFYKKNENFVKQLYGVGLWSTWTELHGVESIKIGKHEIQKSIMQSRTFAYMIESKDDLKTQISNFVSACCLKLRNQKSVCSTVSVFIDTNRHRADLPQYHVFDTLKLSSPLSETPTIIKVALQVLDKIYKPNYQYKKAGVIISDILPENEYQLDLFETQSSEKVKKIMKIADTINAKFGNETVHFAIQGNQNHENQDLPEETEIK